MIKSIKFSKDNWEYETKCRRCGNLQMWHFSEKKSFDWLQFANAMQDYIEHPRTFMCNKCRINTVQDVTTYSLK